MKSKIAKSALFSLALGLCTTAMAQDIHFTQYRQSPLTLNPANTGAIFGDFRAGANFRNQWSKALNGNPITSFSVMFDKPFFVGDYDRVGVGVIAVRDGAGDLGFMTSRIGLSGSYIKLIGNQEIRLGIQGAYTIRAIDMDLSFPEGFNKVTGEFDPDLTSQEPLAKFASGFFDFNVGLGWKGYFGKFRPEAGIAAFHVNGPKETFFAQSDRIAIKSVAHVSFKTFVNRQVFVDPNALIVSQAGTRNLILGLNGGYKLKDNNYRISEVFGGVAVRNGFAENSDAILLIAGINIANFDLGFSYDVNTSNLRTGVSGNGSFEISLLYTAPSTRLIKTKIDSERL
ncbi:MAG TPA: PorP/SprF family type IX secretion system membrane protein [Luteibaculaceae bacterium]|nr:PorP/SprF family type IX secretion system membrane protein [Luteibaculaceae bacterium]